MVTSQNNQERPSAAWHVVLGRPIAGVKGEGWEEPAEELACLQEWGQAMWTCSQTCPTQPGLPSQSPPSSSSLPSHTVHHRVRHCCLSGLAECLAWSGEMRPSWEWGSGGK